MKKYYIVLCCIFTVLYCTVLTVKLCNVLYCIVQRCVVPGVVLYRAAFSFVSRFCVVYAEID